MFPPVSSENSQLLDLDFERDFERAFGPRFFMSRQCFVFVSRTCPGGHGLPFDFRAICGDFDLDLDFDFDFDLDDISIFILCMLSKKKKKETW